MLTLDGLVTYLGINKSAAIWGLIGGLLSLRFVTECGWLARTNTVCMAGIMANLFTDPIYEYFSVKGLGQGGVGFIIGLFSITILAAAFKTLQELEFTKLVMTVLSRYSGGGVKP